MQVTECQAGKMCKKLSLNSLNRISFFHLSFLSSEELRKCYKLIYGAKATIADKTQAHQILQVWKARRCDESLAGVLCSLSLLDVYLKVRHVMIFLQSQ